MGKGMKAGKKPRAPKMDFKAQMAQIQAMQEQMNTIQALIDDTVMEASAGGGAVSVSVNGKHEMVSIKIDKEVLDDVEMLQDLIIAATNEANRKITTATSTEMGELKNSLPAGLPSGIDLGF